MQYKTYLLKHLIERIFIYPFIVIGRWAAFIKPLNQEYEVFFFFPFFHTGGAEKVHALIAQATGNSNCIIYFTRKSYDKNFYNDFVKSGCVIKDISGYTDNKFLYFANIIYRGIVAGYINRQKLKPLVFNGQCNFAYKISPWIIRPVPQVELIHSFNTFSWIRIPYIPFIRKTIMISKVRIEDHLRQYEKIGVPADYASRIQYILNGIPLPTVQHEKDFSGRIKLLYAGRGTEEKRVHLIAKMAEQASLKNLPVDFIFMGDMQEIISPVLLSFCTLLGHKNDPKEIDKIYQQSHVVIITSYTEGFPIVIEEGMARGCVVMSTPVGDIPVHVKSNRNGYLFSSVADETRIVDEGIDFLTLLGDDRMLLEEMSNKNRMYAYENFSIETFNHTYQQLFKQLRNK